MMLKKLLTGAALAVLLAVPFAEAKAQALVPARSFTTAQPSNPANNATTGFLAAGLGVAGAGGGWSITPNASGFVEFTITGDIGNTTTADGVIAAIIFGNTPVGAAPANGAAIPAQAVVCTNPTFTFQALTGVLAVPFSLNCFAQLTPNIAWWADLEIKAVTAGATTLANLHVNAKELN